METTKSKREREGGGGRGRWRRGAGESERGYQTYYKDIIDLCKNEDLEMKKLE